jgi:uncharacterized membrane protein
MSALFGVLHAFAVVETLSRTSFEAHLLGLNLTVVLQACLLVLAFLMTSASHAVLFFELLLLLFPLLRLFALCFVLFVLGDALFGTVSRGHRQSRHLPSCDV